MTLQEAVKLELLVTFRNNWRQRRVEVRAHPTDPDKVISIGYRFGGGEAIICEEPKSAFSAQLRYAGGSAPDFD